MITHNTLAPYMQWKMDYLLTKAMCPPELTTHQNYTTMCINYKAYGQVLYHHLHYHAVAGKNDWEKILCTQQ
jgi:hypothetical protein